MTCAGHILKQPILGFISATLVLLKVKFPVGRLGHRVETICTKFHGSHSVVRRKEDKSHAIAIPGATRQAWLKCQRCLILARLCFCPVTLGLSPLNG